MVQILPQVIKIAEQVGKLVECSGVSNTRQPAMRLIDLNQIQNGILLISVPLTPGNYEFPGLFKPAQVRVKEDTLSWLSVKLNQNPKGKTCISELTITLSKPVVVCNPSTAYEKDGNGFRDLFASVHISGIDIDSQGRVLFQGYMRKGFSTNNIQEDFKPEMFPKVNLELESLLSSRKDTDAETDDNTIHDLLVKLGAVLGEAKCSLKCNTAQGIAELHSKVTLNSKGLMTLIGDSDYTSGFTGSNSSLTLTPELRISGINMLRPKISGTLDINALMGDVARFSSRIQLQKNKPSGFKALLELLMLQPDLLAKFQISTGNLKQGQVSYTLHPGAFHAFSRSLEYQFFSAGRLAIKPTSSGIAEFLCPETQFVTQPNKLLPASTSAVGTLKGQEWFQKAEQIGGAPIRPGNRVKPLRDGVQSFPERLRLIQEAQHSICLQTFIFKDDECGMKEAKALVDAKRRGVCVRVIVDGLGSIESIDDILRDNKAFELLKQHGVELQVYSIDAFLGLKKIIPIAKKYGLLNSINHISDLFSSSQIISTLNLFARLALGTLNFGISEDEKETIIHGLKLILGQKEASELEIEKIANSSKENPLMISDILKILKATISIHQRWHEKHLIADASKTITGGMNIADEYLLGGTGAAVSVLGVSRPAWRDTDFLIEGPASIDAYQQFSRNWFTLTGETLDQPTPLEPFHDGIDTQIIHSRPGSEPFHSITNLKVESINRLQAGDKLYEASAYFIPVGALSCYADALKYAAQRGVDVRILTNSKQSTDLPQLNQAALVMCYRDLLASGVRIFERVGTQTMHQKICTYGTKVSMGGSYNLGNRSDSFDSETTTVIHNEAFALQLENIILDDMAPGKAKEIFLDNIESAPISEELQNSAWAMLAEFM